MLCDGNYGVCACGMEWVRDRNKEKVLLVRRTSDHVRLTCPPIFSLVQNIVHQSTQN